MKSLYMYGLVRFYSIVMLGLIIGLLPVRLESVMYESVRLVYVPTNIKKMLRDVRVRAVASVDDTSQNLQELYQVIDKGASVTYEKTMQGAMAELHVLVKKNGEAALLHELDEYTQELESGSVVLVIDQHKNFIDDVWVWGDAIAHDIFNFIEHVLPECPMGATGAIGATGATGATGGVTNIGCVEVFIKSLFKSGHHYYARYGTIKQIMGAPGAFTIIRPRQITYVLSPDLFTVGEMVTGMTSGAMGIIAADNGMVLSIDHKFGTFVADEIITGSVSRNTATIAVYNEAFSDLIQTTQQGLRANINWNLQASITSGAQTKVSAAMIADSRGIDSVASFISAYDVSMVLPVELGGIAPSVPLANILYWDSPASDILTLQPSKLVIQYLE